MATALYRRYRPEAFSEMIGQAHVTEPLMTALRTGRIGHAYLFSGPRGCGKTTSARILARCLNCAEGPTDTPCGVCPSCIELSREGGGSLDVVEIDAASHGGVDDARDLRERAVFAPARDRYKIFIIDEAHMVTSGGFNALLKIVEEPPPHVKFIFATTEPEKVIGTIRSRTHHYPFRLIAPGPLIDYVQQLCDSEGVQVEPGVLPLVVRAGGGSVRDTLSILDQLIAGSEGDSVALDRATGLLGYTGEELLDEVVAAFGARDARAAFAAADRVVQTGQDPRRFVEDLLERLRDLIVISATTVQGAASVFRGVPADRLERMFEQSQLFRVGELSRVADTVSEALDRMTGATAPRLHLELMVARALAGQTAVSESGAVAPGPVPVPATPPVSQASPAPASSAPSASAAASNAPGSSSAPRPVSPAAPPSAPSAAPAAPAPAAPAREAVDVVATLQSAREFLRGTGSAPEQPARPAPADPPPAASSDEPAASSIEPAAAPVAAPEIGLDELNEVWPDLLEELLSEDREAWNAVRVVQPLALDGDVLTIGVPSRSDLDAFKADGASPLREAIVAALGINVRYVPKPLPAGAQVADRESAPDEEPSPAGEPEGAVPTEPVGEAVASVADEPAPDPAYEPEPVPESAPPADPEPAPGPRFEPETDPELESVPDAEPETDTEPASESESDPQPQRPAAPTTGLTTPNRYGESVVREILGARFIEERPLPQDGD